MRVSGASLALAALLCALFPAGGSAAEFDVGAQPDNAFSPDKLTVAPGDTVNFSNKGGFHNVKFEDGAFEQPSSPSGSAWRVSRNFPSAGRFAYYCVQHGGPGGVGMSGVITVVSPSGTPNPVPTTPAPPKVVSLTVKRVGGGIRVRLQASRSSTATLTLAQRSHGRFRKLLSTRRRVGTAPKTVTFRRGRGGKRLAPGRYRVTVRLSANGVKGPSRSRRITLRPAG